VDWGRKLRPNYVLFDPCKIMEGVDEISKSILRVWPSERLDTEDQKGWLKR